MAEIGIGGVFIPALLVWATIALLLSILLRRLLAAFGL